MEKINATSFDVSGVRIEDGFEYGDWRDKCIDDKLNDEFFNSTKSLFSNQFDNGRRRQTFISIY